MIPRWTEDVGSLRATEGAIVYEKCEVCERQGVVDLDALIEKFGPRYTLWNRRPPCLTEGCEGRRWYRAQPRNYFHRIMMDAPPAFVAELHERWKATLPQDVRDTLPVIPMLKATDQVVVAACGRCDQHYYLSALTTGAWGEQITLDGLAKRLAGMCGPTCEMCTDMIPRAAVPAGEEIA